MLDDKMVIVKHFKASCSIVSLLLRFCLPKMETWQSSIKHWLSE